MRKARGRTRRRQANPSSGSLLRLGAFRRAYFDAFCALEIEQIESLLRDPEFRDLIKRQSREMLEAMIRKMDS